MGPVRVSVAPSIQTESAKVATGKRGEEIVYRKERDRVAFHGLDPDAVFWRSKDDELAPIDGVADGRAANFGAKRQVPQIAPCLGVEGDEVALAVAAEYEPASSRRDPGPRT